MTASEHPRASCENRPFPTFAEFYQAVNGRPPFPWQARLAEEVARKETWPPVGVQTGLGKTACLDIAVWWLASQADRPAAERTAPTRIWWVVNRRLLVDSTAEHAESLACLLDGATGELDDRSQQTVAAVGGRLASLSASPSTKPLQVIRLRGGLASRTPTDPSAPAIILCTLPMYGSRLLFRGYGSKLRAIDAAMAGTDSLVLLDEAHLAPHLEKLLPALAECTPGARSPLGDARSRARLVPLTATGDQSDTPFMLDDADEANPVVRQRLDATKPVALREGAGDGVRSLAEAAHDLLREAPAPRSCLVFANTPKTARAVFDRLSKQFGRNAEVLLLTGLMREREAERIRQWILDPHRGMPANRHADSARERHLVVVATQTLEVGADVDAEYLVTEGCGVRALTQRLGRLNRLGRQSGSQAIYVHVPPKSAKGARRPKEPSPATWPVYGEEPAEVWQRLQDALGDDATVDLAPRQVARVLGPPSDRSSDAPEVLPGILWEWIKTTTPPEGEAPVDPYFSGIEGPSYTASVIWRTHIPKQDERLWPSAADREAIDVPLDDLRTILKDEKVHRLAADGATIEMVSAARLKAGSRVVLPAQGGLMDKFGWNPDATDPVMDTSLAGNGLPLDSQTLEHLCGVRLKRQVETALGTSDEDEDIDQAAQEEAVAEVLGAVRAAATPLGWGDEEWAEFVATLRPRVVQARREVARLCVERPQLERPNIEYDETSLGPEAVELAGHGAAVGRRARDIASSIGLPPHLCEVVATAGRAHDIGKADERFQRWLDPEGRRDAPVAKSGRRRHQWEADRAATGWPRGGRHEALSAWLVEEWLKLAPAWGEQVRRLSADEQQRASELLLHLVISHHGKGRPLVRPVADDTLVEVCGTVEGVAVRVPANLSRVDWNQPARFKRLNDRFGPWGLALLEAILIRADHAVSAGTNFDWDPL